MELLDQLESRVNSLVAEMERLRAENEQLRADVSNGLKTLTEENTSLKRSLEEEQKLKEAVSQRIDMLLQRLQPKRYAYAQVSVRRVDRFQESGV